jgi:hypothetical protein
MAFSKQDKSNRLLQSKRYTVAGTDAAEAYTRVLDLNASEIYIQEAAITASGLPYSGSADNQLTYNSGSSSLPIAKFYYRFLMTPSATKVDSNTRYNAFFFISGSGYTPAFDQTANPQVVQTNQQTNFISNKYADPSLATNKTEDGINEGGTGYNVVVSTNTSDDPDGATPVDASNYQFDYKTGVLQFTSDSVAPTTSTRVYITVYQYLGQTLDSFVAALSGSSGGTGAGFPFSGSAVITGSLLVSGSNVDFSNATSVSISTLTAQSASIDHLTVNTIISGSTIVTSGSNTFGDGMEDTQTLIGTTRITGSAQVTGSLSVSGSLSIQGIADVSASIAAAGNSSNDVTSGIFTEIGSSGVFETTGSLAISASTAALQISPVTESKQQSNAGTGGGVSKYGLVVSQSVWHYSDNIGVPTTNKWKSGLEGSFFNRFDQNTDTAEILRYMAGLLSSSLAGAADASKNLRGFDGIVASNSGGSSLSIPNGRVPRSATNNTIVYSITNGFTAAGGTLFGSSSINGITTQGSENYVQVYRSDTSGTAGTTSNSGDAQLFNLGDVNTQVTVSGSLNFVYHSGSAKKSDIISSSGQLVSATGAPGANNITIGDLPVPNPQVPVTFQDGKFVSLFSSPLKFLGTGLANRFTNPTASMGLYEITASVRIQTTEDGSTSFGSERTSETLLFFADSAEIAGTIADNTITVSGQASASIGTPTSRSLSGAPYLLTNNYRLFTSASGVFNPMFNSSATIAQITANESDEGVGTPANAGGLSKDLGMNNGTLNGNTGDVVFDSTFTTARANGDIPFETDIVALSASIAFNAINSTNTGRTNLSGGTISPATFTGTSTYFKRNGGTQTSAAVFNFHDAGSYDQLLASGSMAYYGRAQGYDPSGSNSATSITEAFTGERWRKKINDTLLLATQAGADNFSTYTDFTLGNLDDKDLQIVPLRDSNNGELIKPGGNKKYWIPTIGSEDYKYYARVFNTNAGAQMDNLHVDIGLTSAQMVSWTDLSGTNTVAAAVLFESTNTTALSARGDVAAGNTMLFDAYPVSVGGQSALGNTSPTAGTNPFGVSLNIKTNNQTGNAFESGGVFGGSTKIKFPLISTQGPLITDAGNSGNGFKQVVVIVRYKGDPSTTVKSIRVNIS